MILRNQRMKYPISSWRGVLKNHPAFILGNGPSIIEHDLSLLSNCFTIGINRIYLIFDPTILLWQDNGLYENGGEKELMKTSAIKVCRTNVDKNGKYTNFKLESNPYKFEKTPGHLWGFGCSGALAIQLAVAMKASCIVLLGIDCDYESADKTDFYGKNEQHRPHTVRNFHRAMRWVKNECTVPIYNCSRTNYWEKRQLSDVVKELNPPQVSKVQWLVRLSLEGA